MKCELCGKGIAWNTDTIDMILFDIETGEKTLSEYHKACYDQSIKEEIEKDYIRVEPCEEGFKIIGRVSTRNIKAKMSWKEEE